MGGVVEDAGRFRHFDHERALAPRQFVAGSDASEDAIGDADGGLRGGDIAADLCHQRQQRHLANVGALAGHVRAGDQQDHAFLVIGDGVVGDECALRFQDVEHGMAAVDDLQRRFVDTRLGRQ